MTVLIISGDDPRVRLRQYGHRQQQRGRHGGHGHGQQKSAWARAPSPRRPLPCKSATRADAIAISAIVLGTGSPSARAPPGSVAERGPAGSATAPRIPASIPPPRHQRHRADNAVAMCSGSVRSRHRIRGPPRQRAAHHQGGRRGQPQMPSTCGCTMSMDGRPGDTGRLEKNADLDDRKRGRPGRAFAMHPNPHATGRKGGCRHRLLQTVRRRAMGYFRIVNG